MHIINHNILHKIIDIMTRNIWKYKFANINKQYYYSIVYNLENVLYKKIICSDCGHKGSFGFNYRKNHHNKCYGCILKLYVQWHN